MYLFLGSLFWFIFLVLKIFVFRSLWVLKFILIYSILNIFSYYLTFNVVYKTSEGKLIIFFYK